VAALCRKWFEREGFVRELGKKYLLTTGLATNVGPGYIIVDPREKARVFVVPAPGANSPLSLWSNNTLDASNS